MKLSRNEFQNRLPIKNRTEIMRTLEKHHVKTVDDFKRYDLSRFEKDWIYDKSVIQTLRETQKVMRALY